MPFKTAEHFKIILTGLSVLRYLLKSSGSRGTTDAYKNSERFFEFILNRTYSWNLVNANALRSNYPAIDLADHKSRICVQITGENSSGKIKKTIKTFFQHNLNAKYDRLVFLILTGKRAYTADFGVPAGFDFDGDRDILDVDDLLRDMEHKPAKVIEAISGHVQHELSSVMQFFAPENSLLAGAETRAQKPPVNARRLLDFLEVDDEEAARVFKDLAAGYERLTSLNEELRSYIYIALTSGETASYFSRDLVQISPVNLEGILRVSHQKHREMYQAVAQKTFADVPEVEGGEAPMLYLTWRLGRYADAFASFKSMFGDQDQRALIVDADFTLLDH